VPPRRSPDERRSPRAPQASRPSRPPVDPRLDRRRIEATRAAGRRRLRVLLIGLGLVGVAAIAVAVVYSPLLDVETVEVLGVVNTPAADVTRVAGIDPGDPVLRVDTGAAETRLRELPWVRSATVERDPPATVRITVVERVAVAWAPAVSGVATVDRDGRVLARAPEPPAGLPEVAGFVAVGRVGGTAKPVAVARLAARLPAELAARTAKATLQDGEATLVLANGVEVRLGEPRQLGAKARVAAAIVAQVAGSAVRYVDVRVPAAPVTG
jgi:cell division protein FtsQ